MFDATVLKHVCAKYDPLCFSLKFFDFAQIKYDITFEIFSGAYFQLHNIDIVW